MKIISYPTIVEWNLFSKSSLLTTFRHVQFAILLLHRHSCGLSLVRSVRLFLPYQTQKLRMRFEKRGWVEILSAWPFFGDQLRQLLSWVPALGWTLAACQTEQLSVLNCFSLSMSLCRTKTAFTGYWSYWCAHFSHVHKLMLLRLQMTSWPVSN